MATTKSRILEEDDFVRKLIDTIPPKIYFNQEVNEFLEDEKHSFIDADVKSLGWRGKKLKIKAKQKRARLDPYLHKTVTQIQDDMEKLNGKGEKKKRGNKAKANPLLLREKLSKKIETLKANRTGPNGQRLKNSKLKPSKESKKNRKKNSGRKAVTFATPQNAEKRDVAAKTEAPVFNKEGKIVYSKFDFMDTNETDAKRKPSIKNKFQKALDKINSDKGKLQELSSKDPERAENLTKKIKWKTALDKAEGIKVKDNPEMLKKSLKRREGKKKKSQKQWAARSENVKKGMDDRHAKRTKNIRAKKQQKIDKKIKLARKKGRFVNGF